MKKKVTVIATSVASMAICASLIAGSTFALFTSNDSVNVAVTAGKVAISAEAKLNEQDTKMYAGTASQDAETGVFKVENVLPGDVVALDVYLTNTSTVTSKYRTAVELENVVGAWSVAIDGIEYKAGEKAASLWRTLAAKTNPEKPVRVSVSLAEGETDQNATCSISCKVEAIQGNAQTTDTVLESYDFSDASQFDAFCPLCWSEKTTENHASHGTFFNPADGAAAIKIGNTDEDPRAAWIAYSDLDWENNYYMIQHQVDVSALKEGEFIAFNAGNTSWHCDVPFGIRNEGGKYVAYKAITDAQATEKTLLGEVASVFTANYTFKKVDDQFVYELKLSGVEKTVTNQAAFGDYEICWCPYTVIDNAATVDNFEFAELSDTKATHYATVATAQDLLDNAQDGDIIYLKGGDYGTLYLGVTDFSEEGIIDTGWPASAGKKGYKRVINNLTIVGAPDAKVDNVVIEGGLYAGPNHSTLSEAHKMPENGTMRYLSAYIEINNLTLKNINFTGEVTALLLRSQVSIDGLTLDGCTMKCADAAKATADKVKLLYWAGKIVSYNDVEGNEVLTNYKKNISVVNCTVENAYQVMETRGVENLTITGNTFKNVSSRDLLLTADATNGLQEVDQYHGKIVIKNNTSIGAGERFIRMTGLGADCELTVTNNTVLDYAGADNDFIKIDVGSGASEIVKLVAHSNRCTPRDASRTVVESITVKQA